MTADKVKIVEQDAKAYGLNVTLDAIGLPKSTWYYWKHQKADYEEKGCAVEKLYHLKC